MIGCIEPRTFKDDLRGGNHLLERLLTAFRTGFERGVREGLMTFELHTTSFTSVGINWHLFFSLLFFIDNAADYSPIDTVGQALNASCYNFLTINGQTLMVMAFCGGRCVKDRDRLLCGLTLHQPGREPGRRFIEEL